MGIELEVEWIRMAHDLDMLTYLHVFDEAIEGQPRGFKELGAGGAGS